MENISLNTILEYTPYDNKCPSPFGNRDKEKVEEDLFYENKLFVEYPPYGKQLQRTIENYTNNDENTHAIVFSGASGSGKTTFLKNHFREQERENKCKCYYINLLDRPTEINSEQCIRTSILNGLGASFKKETAKAFYYKYQSFIKEDNNESDISLLGGSEKLLDFLAFCNLFSRDVSRMNFYTEIKAMNLTIMQLLSLYILTNVINQMNKSVPLVFVFDNLDEMDKQYLSTELNEIILDAFSVSQNFCVSVLHYDFVKYVTFLMSFRIENEKFFKSSEASERYKVLHSVPLEFTQECQVNYEEILNVRIRYYENNGGKEIEKKDKYDKFRLLINTENSFFGRFIKPLFSYDYRMFTHFVIKEALGNSRVNFPDHLAKTHLNKTKKDTQQGSRGVLLFYSLMGMIIDEKSRFYSYVKEEFSDDTCNVYRMSFSLLSNLCGWTHQKDDILGLLENETDFNEKTKQVNLATFMQIIKRWYPEDISKVLEGLIGTTARSYECPITLLGSTIDDQIRKLGKDFSISRLASSVIHDFVENLNGLSTVNIQVNPLCIAYVERVFIHFEYFNLISTQWDNTAQITANMGTEYKHDPRPLFQFDNATRDSQNIRLCLSYTFETVKKIIENADRHFCKKCKLANNKLCTKDCASFIEKYREEGFCINKTLLATRIISAHIRYLEHYRRYFWFKNGDKGRSDDDIIIQRIIAKQILDYIEFYKGRDVKDSNYQWITIYWKKQYENVLISLEYDTQNYIEIRFEE